MNGLLGGGYAGEAMQAKAAYMPTLKDRITSAVFQAQERLDAARAVLGD